MKLNTSISWLVGMTLLVNAAAMFTNIIYEGDSVVYAALAQHMVSSGNWSDLVLSGNDWLDKPHFPFWMTALSFKLLGVSAFAYILPGFLFHLLACWGVYRLARSLYAGELDGGRSIARWAVLVFASAFHVMHSATVVRAEVYLSATITIAAYYWLRFDETGRAKHFVMGAAFAAMSVMTKGIFTLITVGSGLVAYWIFAGRWREFLRLRWWLAIVVTLLFLAPEVISLYLQFDEHPEKVVFGRTNVSGIQFFLWDSQFGRFFNSGPIRNEAGDPLYFFHVFLWAFLPWVGAFFMGVFTSLTEWKNSDQRHKRATVFLAGSFALTFVVFSATSFQLDYYTVILYPFAAIICARTLHSASVSGSSRRTRHALLVLQALTTLLVLALGMGMAWYVQMPTPQVIAALAFVLAALAVVVCMRLDAQEVGAPRVRSWFAVVAIAPVIAVNGLYSSVDAFTYRAYDRYSVPINVQKILAHDEGSSGLPIFVYRMDYIVPLELALYSNRPVRGFDQAVDLAQLKSPYILVTRTKDLDQLVSAVPSQELSRRKIGGGDWVDHKTGILPRTLQLARGVEPLDNMQVIQVGEK